MTTRQTLIDACALRLYGQRVSGARALQRPVNYTPLDTDCDEHLVTIEEVLGIEMECIAGAEGYVEQVSGLGMSRLRNAIASLANQMLDDRESVRGDEVPG